MAHCVQSFSVSQAQIEGLSIGSLRLSYSDVMRATIKHINALYYTCIAAAALTEVP